MKSLNRTKFIGMSYKGNDLFAEAKTVKQLVIKLTREAEAYDKGKRPFNRMEFMKELRGMIATSILHKRQNEGGESEFDRKLINYVALCIEHNKPESNPKLN